MKIEVSTAADWEKIFWNLWIISRVTREKVEKKKDDRTIAMICSISCNLHFKYVSDVIRK